MGLRETDSVPDIHTFCVSMAKLKEEADFRPT
jgi:hypothetical protein